jgi:hypothetical protein
MAKREPMFASEAELCAQFKAYAEKAKWIVYAETAGWDLLLVRADGYQVGIQAKLQLNAHVVAQAIEDRYDSPGPDFRAVLTPPSPQAALFATIASACGVTIIMALRKGECDVRGWYRERGHSGPAWSAMLPTEDRTWGHDQWHERAPTRRHKLPSYVPDVPAGVPAPVQLTEWKIKAMKIAAIIEKRGWVCRADFKHIGLDPRRWLNDWLDVSPEGRLIPGKFFPHFKRGHVKVYAQIVADWKDWAPPEPAVVLP